MTDNHIHITLDKQCTHYL